MNGKINGNGIKLNVHTLKSWMEIITMVVIIALAYATLSAQIARTAETLTDVKQEVRRNFNEHDNYITREEMKTIIDAINQKLDFLIDQIRREKKK